MVTTKYFQESNVTLLTRPSRSPELTLIKDVVIGYDW